MARIPCNEAVLKLLSPGSIVRFEGVSQEVRPEPITQPVVDTTAAGDSFNAAYLAARLAGLPLGDAVLYGHRLSAIVVSHRGAIVPQATTAELLEELRSCES